jgi:hypothetical protein
MPWKQSAIDHISMTDAFLSSNLNRAKSTISKFRTSLPSNENLLRNISIKTPIYFLCFSPFRAFLILLVSRKWKTHRNIGER